MVFPAGDKVVSKKNNYHTCTCTCIHVDWLLDHNYTHDF